jgi:hypothetical protein
MERSKHVSILRRTSHLDDAAFAELWTNALADGTTTVDQPHLQECAECRLRFASFSNWMEEVRTEARTEADEVLSPERLAAQQAQIFRRLEAAERPARVIAFPKHSPGSVRQFPIRRWIATAAAAGLITGVGLGQMWNFRLAAPAGFSDRIVDTTPRSLPGPTAVPALATVSDEATLEEIEEISTPRYEALRAYDTFTPRAADFVQPR